jgi:AcrR family transcriptional regulator
VAEFLKHGYADANVDRIAAACGSSKPALYRRYASKELLFEAALEHFARYFPPDLSFLDPDAPADDVLYRAARLFYDKLGSPQVLASTRLGAAESVRFPALILRFRQQVMDGFIPQLMAYFEQLHAKGLVRIDDLQEAAIIFTTLTGRPYDRVMGAAVPPRRLPAHLRELVRFFLAGYAPR